MRDQREIAMKKDPLVLPPGKVLADPNTLPHMEEANRQQPASGPPPCLPDHNDLPDKDGAIVTNSQEHPQSRLLSSSIEPLLRRQHPDGRFFIGQDIGIYY